MRWVETVKRLTVSGKKSDGATILVSDGMFMGGPGGVLLRVVAPRWWQVWRWVAYLFEKRRGVVQVTDARGSHRIRVVVVGDAIPVRRLDDR